MNVLLMLVGRAMEQQQPAEKQETGATLLCKFCGNQMALTRLEPSILPDHDHITYECLHCGHSLSKEIRYR
jgi:transcription elongation factor Elf1